MFELKWLFTLSYRSFKNRFFFDKSSKTKFTFMLVSLSLLMYLSTRLIYSIYPFSIDETSHYFEATIFMFLLFMMIWVFLMSFIQSFSYFSKIFYKSSENNQIMTLPISHSTLFIFNYIRLIYTANKSTLLLYIPFAATIGLYINAPVYYYILLIPVYFFVTIFPSSLAVMISLIGLKFVSLKVFSIVTTLLSLLLNIGFALSFTRMDTILSKFSPLIELIFKSAYISNFIPVISNARIFMIFGGISYNYTSLLIYIILSTILIIANIFLAKKTYYTSWEKNQIESAIQHKKNKNVIVKKQLSHINLVSSWVKKEWIMAKRNTDMYIASFSMLSFYLLSVLALSFGNFFGNEIYLEVALLISVATVFNVMAVSLVFLPAQLSKDKSLWKSRFWLLKILPLNSLTVMFIQVLMYFIPAFVISILGLAVYALSVGLSMPLVFISSLLMGVFLLGASLVYVATEMLSLNDFFEKTPHLGNILTFIIPIVYAILSVGFITLYYAKDYVTHIAILNSLTNVISLPITTIVSISAIALTVIYSIKVFTHTWNKLEIK